MRAAPVAVALLLALGLAGCGDGGSEEPNAALSPTASPQPSPTSGQFEQTWTKSYGETTCEEWNTQMETQEQAVAGSDMLIAGRRSDGINDLPSTQLMAQFADGINQSCTVEGVGTMTIAEVGAALYTIGANEGGTGEWRE